MEIAIITLLVLNAVQFLSSLWLHIKTSKCRASKCLEVEVDMNETEMNGVISKN
jgi:hypothetical protein